MVPDLVGTGVIKNPYYFSMNTFDDNTHSYTIDGRKVPSVTQIINSFIIPRACDPWYLQRGSANHACYAMIALGKEFECAPECEPFVRGCRKFFAEVKPEVVDVERIMFSKRYLFGGTLDLLAVINGCLMIVDYKGSITESLEYQLGSYSLLYEELKGKKIRYGVGVRIKEDGKYSMTKPIDLRRSANGFLAMRTVYGIINK